MTTGSDPRTPARRAVMMRYRSVRKGLTAWTMGRVLDLSITNARVICDHAFALDEDMEVHLRLPKDQAIVLRARVAWARPFGVRQFEYVIAFGTLDPSVQQAIIGALSGPG